MNGRLACILTVALSTASCAHVKQKDLDLQLGKLRGEMEERMDHGDAALAGRIDAAEAAAAALRSDLAALERDFGAKVEELEGSLRVLAPVHFEFDQADVEAPGREVLARFAGVANTYYPAARVTVEGFTDPAGSSDYNLRLGQRRAEAVKAYLVAEGLAAERVRAVSYGESAERLVAPGARGPGTEGWENRRVVLVIDHDGAPPANPIAAGGSEERR